MGRGGGKKCAEIKRLQCREKKMKGTRKATIKGKKTVRGGGGGGWGGKNSRKNPHCRGFLLVGFWGVTSGG